MQNESIPKSPPQTAILATYLIMLLVASTANALQPTTRLTQYAHREWRLGDAGLMGTPQDIGQTADGYIWVSTQNGLFRFDGWRFAKWLPRTGESLPSSSMWHLFGARDGSLYVGTDGGLARINNGHVFAYPGSPRWPGPFVEDSGGGVWMGVNGVDSDPSALCKAGKQSLTCLGAAAGFACTRGISNAIDAHGTFWIGGTEGICRWKPGSSPEAELIPALLRRKGLSSVRSIATSSDGSLWAGLDVKGKGAGLLRYTNGRWISYIVPGIDGRDFFVSSLLAERNGSLWIGTADKGLYKLSDGRLDHFDTADGLSDHNVLSIFEDHEGGVWVVTPKGVDYFRDYAVLSFTSSEGSLADHAHGVASDRHGAVFLASSTLACLRGQKLTAVKDDRGRLLTDVQILFNDSRDNIWIGAGARLLVARGGKPPSAISSYRASPGTVLDYLTEDREHDIWASVEELAPRVSWLIQIRNGQAIEKFKETSTMGNQAMNALAPDPAGGLWVGGAAHGLFRFHEGLFDRVPMDGFNDRVENLMQEPGGALWIVTQRGFVRYFNGEAKRLTVASGLPCDSGVNIQEDGAGFKWFYMHCGILRVSDAELAAWWQGSKGSVSGKFFDALDGARPNLSNGSPAQAPDGKLWSASDYEFQIIDPHQLPFNKVPPPVTIERLAADGKDFIPDHDLALPMHTRQIEFDYAGLSFLIPELVRFRYRLQGHDADWIEAGNRGQAFYNDLPPGRYVFHVAACNNDGIWSSKDAALIFTIRPAWYQLMIFRLAAVLLAIALAILIYSSRMRRYEALLKLRFDDRMQERTRLARDLHDTLLQTIQGSKMVADEAREHVDDPPQTARSLDRLSDWLGRASIEGRTALEALRSSSIETNDLAGALYRIADDYAAGGAMKVHVLALGPSQEMHPIARDEVYRIAHEAIRNAQAHSGAKDLWIELEYKRRFHVQIRDNGRGLGEEILRAGKPGHFGLAGMRERALFLGGELTLSSSPQNGTRISLQIPGQSIYKYPGVGVRSWLIHLFRPKSGDRR
jgi:signal transduction histidine kinase/ligand-binding sensor domain-containing protein